MKSFTIDLSGINNWNSFHEVFFNKMGFPKHYGYNLDAWIDSMSNPSDLAGLEDKENEIIVLNLLNMKQLKYSNPDIYDFIIETSAFVNWRRLAVNEPPILMLSFDLNDNE